MVSFIDILNLSSHTWDFSLSMTNIYRAVSKVVSGPRPRREQLWVQATPSVMRDICRAVSNVVTEPHPTRSIMRSGNPIYELLYEFTLHCHLLGNLSIRNSPFWQQWFQISRNRKHYCINNSEIWGRTQHLLCSFSNHSVALPTSQLILQPFLCFTYVTSHSPTLLSLFLRQRLFTYATWRAAHGNY